MERGKYRGKDKAGEEKTTRKWKKKEILRGASPVLQEAKSHLKKSTKESFI